MSGISVIQREVFLYAFVVDGYSIIVYCVNVALFLYHQEVRM